MTVRLKDLRGKKKRREERGIKKKKGEKGEERERDEGGVSNVLDELHLREASDKMLKKRESTEKPAPSKTAIDRKESEGPSSTESKGIVMTAITKKEKTRSHAKKASIESQREIGVWERFN